MAIVNFTSETLQKLKFVRTSGLRAGKYSFPDFLIIGPQRTGTTWLHKNLQFHPDILMPRQKELFFFSNLKIKQSNKTYSSDELAWYLNKFRLFSINGVGKILHNIIESGQIRIPKVLGEATASYAVMENDLIEEIFTLHPDIKIILFIRNPIERAWSNAKRILVKEKGFEFEQVPFKEFEKFYKDENQIRGGRYTKTIHRWQNYVKPNNFFVGFFDSIKDNPEGLLKRVLQFLNIAPDARFPRKIRQRR